MMRTPYDWPHLDAAALLAELDDLDPDDRPEGE